MGNQPAALEKLFDKWAQKHEKKLSSGKPYLVEHEPPYGGFVRDGIIDPENWDKQKLKICFILNEAGGYNDRAVYPEGHDLAAEWKEKGCFTKLMKNMVVWIQAVHDAFIPPIDYDKGRIMSKQHELIRSIAIINIRKSDGQVKPNFKELKNFSHTDAAEIRKELEIISPDIIFTCNNFKNLSGKRPENSTPRSKRQWVFYDDEIDVAERRSFKWEDALILNLWSPAQFVRPMSSKVINYYAVREICRAALKWCDFER